MIPIAAHITPGQVPFRGNPVLSHEIELSRRGDHGTDAPGSIVEAVHRGTAVPVRKKQIPGEVFDTHGGARGQRTAFCKLPARFREMAAQQHAAIGPVSNELQCVLRDQPVHIGITGKESARFHGVKQPMPDTVRRIPEIPVHIPGAVQRTGCGAPFCQVQFILRQHIRKRRRTVPPEDVLIFIFQQKITADFIIQHVQQDFLNDRNVPFR